MVYTETNFQGPNVHQINKLNYLTHSVCCFEWSDHAKKQNESR